jgi:hypothetical protein
VLQLHRRSLLGHGDDDDSRSHGKGKLDWGRTGPDTDVVFAQASDLDRISQPPEYGGAAKLPTF